MRKKRRQNCFQNMLTKNYKEIIKQNRIKTKMTKTGQNKPKRYKQARKTPKRPKNI